MHERILVVDDDYPIREGLAVVLRDQGYGVVTAADGGAAFQLLNEDSFDLIITDMSMKDPATGKASARAGIELLEKVQRAFPGIPVVMITGMPGVDTAVEALRSGAVHYITKPFKPKEIRRVVHEALAERHGVATDATFPPITSKAPSMVQAVDAAARAAKSDVTVLITGEPGTGKEFTARAIHSHSSRAAEPFVAISARAIPEILFEAEVFGAEKGAYTGAVKMKRGAMELAGLGTVLLDSVDEIPLAQQAKLILPIEKREIRRVGGGRPVKLGARFIAISSVNLAALAQAKTFRDDLYYTLKVLSIDLPPLRHRLEDVPDLSRRFLVEISRESQRPFTLREDAAPLLLNYHYPGNIRELRNILRSAAVQTKGGDIGIEELKKALPSFGIVTNSGMKSTMQDTVALAERTRIQEALARHPRNLTIAADELGISRTTLWRKMREHGLLNGTDEIVSI